MGTEVQKLKETIDRLQNSLDLQGKKYSQLFREHEDLKAGTRVSVIEELSRENNTLKDMITGLNEQVRLLKHKATIHDDKRLKEELIKFNRVQEEFPDLDILPPSKIVRSKV
jgi:FtsZ-binding cell division protein ZapB